MTKAKMEQRLSVKRPRLSKVSLKVAGVFWSGGELGKPIKDLASRVFDLPGEVGVPVIRPRVGDGVIVDEDNASYLDGDAGKKHWGYSCTMVCWLGREEVRVVVSLAKS